MGGKKKQGNFRRLIKALLHKGNLRSGAFAYKVNGKMQLGVNRWKFALSSTSQGKHAS